MSWVGVLGLLAVAYGLGPGYLRRRIRWRTVGGALGLLVIGTVVLLKSPAGEAFQQSSRVVEGLLGFAAEGSKFVFGPLANADSSIGFSFAFQVLPSIVFFSALMSVAYYVRLLPVLVERGGRFLSRTLGTSGPESLSTVADIFVGQTEAPLVIRPYLAQLTQSELCACMVAGFATTAGGVLAAYVGMLSREIPDIAAHLIAASVLAAPASLAVAKLIMPEAEVGTAGQRQESLPRIHASLFEAVAVGVSDGIKLAVNVAGMLLVFVALTALVNAALTRVAAYCGVTLTLETLLGWLFSPVALAMGVPPNEALKVGALLGQKTVFNEFVAYSNLSQMLDGDPACLSARSKLITSYALCGFANFGSIGIQIGGYAALAPERRGDVARLALRAMVGGILSTCLVAAVVGGVV